MEQEAPIFRRGHDLGATSFEGEVASFISGPDRTLGYAARANLAWTYSFNGDGLVPVAMSLDTALMMADDDQGPFTIHRLTWGASITQEDLDTFGLVHRDPWTRLHSAIARAQRTDGTHASGEEFTQGFCEGLATRAGELRDRLVDGPVGYVLSVDGSWEAGPLDATHFPVQVRSPRSASTKAILFDFLGRHVVIHEVRASLYGV